MRGKRFVAPVLPIALRGLEGSMGHSAGSKRDVTGPELPEGREREPALATIGRRRFITYLIAAPTLTVAARYLDVLSPSPAAAQTAGNYADTILEIMPDNRIAVRIERHEMGQGPITVLAMMIAEELDARLADIEITLAPAGLTGGSSTVSGAWDSVRSTGATARAHLVTAAAEMWGLDATTLTTRDTAVWAPDGRSATYGELTAAAAQVTSPAVSTDPKPYSEHRVIGQPTRQLQVRDIVTGKMRYTQDVKVPGAVATVVSRPPTINGNVVAVDSSAAEAMEGVIAVTQIPSGVAVSAATFHHAMKARDALVITWAPGPMAGMSDAEIRQQLAAAAPDMPPPLPSAEYVEGTFQFNFTPHNLMEVFDAVADVRSDGADIWVGTQFPQGVQAQVAAAIGMTPESVTVHHLRSGGGFGGRIFALAEIEAAQVSQAIGKPVKLMWSRPDVVRHGHMRGASYHQIRVLLSQGIVWDHYATSVDFNIPAQASPFVASSILPMQTYISMPYDVGQFVARSSTHALAMHTTPYRAPMSYPVATAREVMVDEAAAALGQDPVAFRRSLIKTDRGIAVLDKVAQTGNWGRAMPRGCAQGVAYHEEYGSLMAALVEIDATDPQAPRVTKLLIVVDAGLPANPLGIASQVMGGAQNGMAEVLQAGVHIDDGAVREHTFGDVMWTRQRNHPLESECHIMPRNGEPGGCGEVGPCVASGATANAYARATGTKPRNFPIINF